MEDLKDDITKEENINTDEQTVEKNDEQAAVEIDELHIEEIEEIPDELKNSLEIPEETSNESIDIKPEEANTTNCLALTIQKEHKMVAVKNVILRSIRMSWKVAVSTITLALIKLFS